MPHRVANFIRSSTENLSNIKATVTRRQSPHSRHSRHDVFDDSASSQMSDEESPHQLARRQHRRISFALKTKKENLEGATLDWTIESPPIVFHGDAESSAGALFSGQLLIRVHEPMIGVGSFKASLRMHVTHKRPFHTHCQDCGNQYTDLQQWVFLRQPTTLQKGDHQFPFSVLLPGNLPASMDTSLVSITYEFKAEATRFRVPPSSTSTAHHAPLRLEKNLEIKRSIPERELPHHSVRVFPPTNVKSSAHFEQVIHPTGTHTLSMRLDGLTNTVDQSQVVEYWRLKKVTWRLEETIKTMAPACPKHIPQNADAPESNSMKSSPRTETRILGEKSLSDGWKGDYDREGGFLEFEINYAALKPKNHDLRYACNTKTRDGIEVSHAVMVELVVSREWAPAGKPELLAHTGTGRILRMHYQVILTELPDPKAVSWDTESPPVYEDVPPSPPAYPEMEDPMAYADLAPLEAARDSRESR